MYAEEEHPDEPKCFKVSQQIMGGDRGQGALLLMSKPLKDSHRVELFYTKIVGSWAWLIFVHETYFEC